MPWYFELCCPVKLNEKIEGLSIFGLSPDTSFRSFFTAISTYATNKGHLYVIHQLSKLFIMLSGLLPVSGQFCQLFVAHNTQITQ
jgi:hypothetical protein